MEEIDDFYQIYEMDLKHFNQALEINNNIT